jgi:(1->4)-alpha-D-glucan 1-alpha-D-glucosylmutase
VAAPAPSHVPASTYRLQLTKALGFEAAAKLVPYLDRLGITTCYASPVLAARPGSTHGYDTCDHSRISPELGGDVAFEAWADRLHDAGLGLIVDFVPNHMSIHPVANAWWRDVLENGPASEHARAFDIDWQPVKVELESKVLLPMLADQYGVVLDAGELRIVLEDGAFSLRYYEHDLPLNPSQLRMLLQHRLDLLQASTEALDPGLNELMSILFQLEHLPPHTERDPALIELRSREKEIAKIRLARLLADYPHIRAHVEENIRLFNGTPGDSRSFNLLHELLEGQAYRLAYWRTATHEINYRRFFDINELAGIRVEEPAVFAAVHARIGELLRAGKIDGLRLDHIDGLFDPVGYLERLGTLADPALPYIVVEKILSRDERLPDHWHTHGTTGYDFMNDVNGLFVDRAAGPAFRTIYRRFTGRTEPFEDVVYTCKKLVIASSMSSELNVLAHWLNRISEQRRHTRDFTLDSLQEALREVVACFPVYRSYFGYQGATPLDHQWLDEAVERALARNPTAESSIYAFIREMLSPEQRADLTEDEYVERRRFAMKFQQYTGPVEAKGVEDTAFYRYTPLVSLNEVGGDPARFGRTVEQFHEANRERRARWPYAMLATATHDTKRGEDARARISVLSEIPDEWRTIVSRWSRANASARTPVNGQPAPSRSAEYLFYQALVGAWPPGLDGPPDGTFVARIAAYMEKAAREAKVNTSWIRPSAEYEAALRTFVERALTGRNSTTFLPLFLPFVGRVSRLGAVNGLSQLLLKVASPGVPDIYNGCETWDHSLVDPDNRRPVDFGRLDAWLSDILLWLQADPARRIERWTDLLTDWTDGRVKLAVTTALLRFRRAHRDLFIEGSYEPLEPDGAQRDHVVAFARRLGDRVAIAVAPRLVSRLFTGAAPLPPPRDAWQDLVVPLPDAFGSATFRHVLTGEPVAPVTVDGRSALRVADLLRHVPIALVAAVPEDSQR